MRRLVHHDADDEAEQEGHRGGFCWKIEEHPLMIHAQPGGWTLADPRDRDGDVVARVGDIEESWGSSISAESATVPSSVIPAVTRDVTPALASSLCTRETVTRTFALVSGLISTTLAPCTMGSGVWP